MASKERTATTTHDGEPSGSDDLHGLTITHTHDYIEELESLNEAIAYWEGEVAFEEKSIRYSGGTLGPAGWRYAMTRLSALREERRSLLAKPVIVAMWKRSVELRRQALAARE